MKLQEFLCFRKTCFICSAPINFTITDWTDIKNPQTMSIGTLKGLRLLKSSHEGLGLFFSPHKNEFNIFPNENRTIDIEIEGHCLTDPTHYMFESQMLRLNYQEKTWSTIPEIELQEVIHIGQGHVFSAVNSYSDESTSVIRSGLSQHIALPLINTSKLSFEEFNQRLKVYLTFS